MFRKPPKIDRLRHRSWEDVALMYNARTGESLTEHQARDIGLRAAKRIARELRKPANYRLREALAAEGIVV
jgi:hypothetical protein